MEDSAAMLLRLAPVLFEAALDRLRDEAGQGDGAAQQALQEVAQAELALRLELTGEHARVLFGSLQAGELCLGEAPLDGPDVFLAARVDGAAVVAGLEYLQGQDWQQRPRDLQVAAKACSRARQVLGQHALAFDVTVSEVPQVGTLEVRAALGQQEVPAQPDFSMSLGYRDALDAQRARTGLQQLVADKKLIVQGNAARFMALGMMLMQLR